MFSENEEKFNTLEEKGNIVYLSVNIRGEFAVSMSSDNFYWYRDMETDKYILCFDNSSIDVKPENIKEINIQESEICIEYL